MRRMRGSAALAALACACVNADAARAPASPAENYPDRPIRLIAPFVPGGPTDIVARLVAQKLTDNLKQTVVVDNRGGAGGVVGMQLAAAAAPDGYTMVLGSSGNLAVNPALEPNLPYRPLQDFQPITYTSSYPKIVVLPVSRSVKIV